MEGFVIFTFSPSQFLARHFSIQCNGINDRLDHTLRNPTIHQAKTCICHKNICSSLQHDIALTNSLVPRTVSFVRVLVEGGSQRPSILVDTKKLSRLSCCRWYFMTLRKSRSETRGANVNLMIVNS